MIWRLFYVKNQKNYRNEIMFFVLMVLIYFMLFCFFGKKKVLAAENGQVNLEAWSLTDMKTEDGSTTTNATETVEATLVYDNYVERNFQDIVIPNAADFRNVYPNLEKVWITSNTVQSVANNANKTDGSIKISDTGGDDNSINGDVKKVFAKDQCHQGFSHHGQIKSIDLSNFDTSNVIDMSYIFDECGSLTSLNLSSLDTKNVNYMNSMFQGCRNLTSLNLSNFNTNSVTSMSAMFYGCRNLTSLNLSNFDTSRVAYMEYMFYNCSSLVDWDFLDKFDFSSVDRSYKMFYGCQFSNSDTFNSIKNFVGGDNT